MSTLKSAREIDRVFESGRRFSSRLVIGLVAPTPTGRDPQGRVAVVAGKRIGGAVIRNRAKRLLREGARAGGAPWPGYDVVLLARESTVRADGAELGREIASIAQRSGAAG